MIQTKLPVEKKFLEWDGCCFWNESLKFDALVIVLCSKPTSQLLFGVIWNKGFDKNCKNDDFVFLDDGNVTSCWIDVQDSEVDTVFFEFFNSWDEKFGKEFKLNEHWSGRSLPIAPILLFSWPVFGNSWESFWNIFLNDCWFNFEDEISDFKVFNCCFNLADAFNCLIHVKYFCCSSGVKDDNGGNKVPVAAAADAIIAAWLLKFVSLATDFLIKLGKFVFVSLNFELVWKFFES